MTDSDVVAWVQQMSDSYVRYSPPPEAVGMTTRNELCFVESFTRDIFTGNGRIVDLGCWYGATTAALARGLRNNKRDLENRVVEAFDLFIWQKWMMRHAHRVEHLGVHYDEDDSFLDDVRELLQPYADIVRLQARDLLELPEVPEQPIEFLFVDAQKSWSLGRSIATAYFPALIPGSSYLVQQDFVWYHPSILSVHMLMWYLRDHFEFVHHVPASCSTVFICVKKADLIETPLPTPEFFTLGMIDDAYEWTLGCADPARHAYLRAAKLCFLLDRMLYEAALQEAEKLFDARQKLPGDLIEGMVGVLRSYTAKAERAATAEPAVECLRAITERIVRRSSPSIAR